MNSGVCYQSTIIPEFLSTNFTPMRLQLGVNLLYLLILLYFRHVCQSKVISQLKWRWSEHSSYEILVPQDLLLQEQILP